MISPAKLAPIEVADGDPPVPAAAIEMLAKLLLSIADERIINGEVNGTTDEET